ncbi:ImmA/IrrE family metallo-endopeptidase [Lactococcus lactis]|uniref:ImmA/IrrE family metallo-endopeptidase n=1 Tax=Lactococcus lactis TaxID=1358 RepID=UPI0025A23A13|nr:ImmA/IrrE family metallo-endopeptidase [Lactococcus lactis]MDM7509943.1 ImmA/IrrE family metallo-endopeptidase [Lactococcus lactis]
MNKKIEKYSDIFSPDFLNYFGEDKDKIGNIEHSSGDYKIDLDKIIKEMNLKVEETFLDLSGEFDPDKRTIYVNIFEADQRQRFTKAHEIGHCVFKHEGVSHRNTNVPSSPKERAANQFAAELLLPPKLIGKAIEKYMVDKKMDKEAFENSSEERLVKYLSESMGVSKQAMKYRLYNLGVITD